MNRKSDRTKRFIFESIVFNNRLLWYEEYIERYRKAGYTILSLDSFYKLENRRDGKHLILRHDVDHPGKDTRKLFETEKKLGVKSTYYFRFSTIDTKLIDEMVEAGFDVGLHYETISDYIVANKVSDPAEIDIEALRMKLKDEIAEFERIIGHKTFSCCSHGAGTEGYLEMKNNTLTENRDVKCLGVEVEAYDVDLYARDIDCHIMDNKVLFNYGFSYKDNPLSALDEGKQNVVFLAHPSHWYLKIRRRVRLLGGWVLGRADYETTRAFEL